MADPVQAATGPSTATPPRLDRWPAQIKYIVGNEACERFSYYGMRSILAGYISGEVLKGGLGQSPDTATSIIHLFIFANYFMPLFGAWLSDKVIGRYHTILWVSLFYCAGHGVLACSDFAGGVHGKMLCLFTGLALIAFGSGGIKPCVSAFVGDQFRPDQSHLLQKAYSAFYWSINLGSFFSFLVIPFIKGHYGYSWAFGVPGIFMGLATLIFWIGTPQYHRVPCAGDPDWPKKAAGIFGLFVGVAACVWLAINQPEIWSRTWKGGLVLGALASLYATYRLHKRVDAGPANQESNFFVVWWYAVTKRLVGTSQPWNLVAKKFSHRAWDKGRSFGRILSIFIFIPPFWALFDQTNSTWVMQGERMVPFKVLGFSVGAEEMQSFNPLLVMLLVPVLTLGLYPLLGKLATPLRRMSAGLFLVAGSYVIVALIQQRIDAEAQLSIAWQMLPYLVLTTAEVLLSTTGLEFAFTQSAPEMKSTIMSFWLLTTALGNLLVTLITSVLSGHGEGGHAGSVTASRFMLYAGLTLVVAVLFSLTAAFYKYREQDSV
jgi:POT family proton-dependent oligopeptide transporter